MDKEGRYGLECFDFLTCRHLSGQTQIEQTGTDLSPDAFEQVEFLYRIAQAINAVGQDRHAQAAPGGSQRQADSIAALRKFARADLPQARGPALFGCIQIKRVDQCLQPLETRTGRNRLR